MGSKQKQISLTYTTVAQDGQSPAVYCLLDRDFITAVGIDEVREAFEHNSWILPGEPRILFLVSTENDIRLNQLISTANDKDYTINIDFSEILNPDLSARDDLIAKYPNVAAMVYDLTSDGLDLSRNAEITPVG